MTGRACLEQGLQALPMDIPASAVDQFLEFSDRLLEKNKVMNLTAVTDPDEVISRHFLDCARAPGSPACRSPFCVRIPSLCCWTRCASASTF